MAVATVAAAAVVVAVEVVAVDTAGLQDSVPHQPVAERIAWAVVVVGRLSMQPRIRSVVDEAILVMWQRANRPFPPDHPSFADHCSSMDRRHSGRSSSTVTYLHQPTPHRPQIA
uniref:Putative secreted protein n=1 Tax=Anopheles darlingi TaxID=43151 RepID=A0A2M4D688_ANODA